MSRRLVVALLLLGIIGGAALLLRQTTPQPPPTDPPRVSAADHFRLGAALAEQGRLTPAYESLQKAVEAEPSKSAYRLRLAMLLYVAGDYPQAHRHWSYLLQHGGLDLISFPLLGNRELRWGYEDRALDAGFVADPEDPLVLQGLGHRAFQQKDFEGSENRLRAALRIAPDLQESRVRLAQLLFEAGRPGELAEWLGTMDPATLAHPQIWMLRGHLCRQSLDSPGAARCFGEAFERDPYDHAISGSLSQAMFALGRKQEAELLAQRSEVLRKYESICRTIHLHEEVSQNHLQLAAAYSEQAGCFRDVLGWCTAALAIAPGEAWALETYRRVQPKIHAGPERSSPEHDLRNRIDVTQYPIPALPSADNASAQPPGSLAGSAAASSITFEDATASAGLDFVFQDGADATSETTRLFEFTGGGVAVLDYDLNGWPDIFLVQGGPPPALGNPASSPPTAEPPSDHLYRNLTNGRLLQVADVAGVADGLYGQGATIGDYDADGFPDLYVANIGANVLYRNNGDGTFQKAEIAALQVAPQWTTSCVMADFNGDALPDIYDVSYVENDFIHQRMCRSGDASVPCDASQSMRAGQDRMFLNRGDGSFEDITARSGVVAKEGIGLGVVAADFDGLDGLDLFVANDARANYLFLNQGRDDGLPVFEDQAVLRGIALSGSGRAQACMGIAVDDMDRDGLLDLFITNFYADYNTMYRQQPGCIFEDATHPAGLQAVSYDRLGFGTQFLDADLDGLADLVLTNGDVVDFSSVTPARQYAQAPQFLKNLGKGKFTEVPAAQLGEFFQQHHIGRGLARLDWNRDGREEFVVSHIGSAARLLTNATPTTGGYLDVRLVGTSSNRDAIGATIAVETDTGRWTKQLTAGDGYMASNQRNRIFGLGNSQHIQQITVRWPSQQTDTLQVDALNRTVLIVEGSQQAFFVD